MTSTTERAVRAYEAAWQEPDPVKRAALLDACFAVDGRIVTSGIPIRGRAALAQAMATFLADPRGLSARIVGPIDAKGPTFRFHSTITHRDGTVLPAFDAGEVDANGHIAVLITFGGPMPT